MKATLTRAEVRRVDRRDDETRRLLRLAWLAGLGGVEDMAPTDLRDALRFRGKLRAGDPAHVDSLLPLYPEGDAVWLARRNAADALSDPDARFVRFREFTLPETGSGDEAAPRNTTELIDSPAGRAAFGAIQAVTPFDAVQEQLDDLSDRGCGGAIVTQLDFAADSDRADASATFYSRGADGSWTATIARNAFATVDEPQDRVETDPETQPESATIRTALRIFESVAASPSQPELSERRQRVGATAQRAMARARAALNADLAPLALPVFSQEP
jgi:hypothetical protein